LVVARWAVVLVCVDAVAQVPEPPPEFHAPLIVFGTDLSPAEYAATFVGVPVTRLVEKEPPDLLAPPDREPPEGIWEMSWAITPDAAAPADKPVPEAVALHYPADVKASWGPPPAAVRREPPASDEDVRQSMPGLLSRLGFAPDAFEIVRLHVGSRDDTGVTAHYVYLRGREAEAGQSRGDLSVQWNSSFDYPESVGWYPPRPRIEPQPTRPVEVTLEQARDLLKQALARVGVAEYKELHEPMLSTHTPSAGEDGHPFYQMYVVPRDKFQAWYSGPWYVDGWTGQTGRRADFTYGRDRIFCELEWRELRIRAGKDPYYPGPWFYHDYPRSPRTGPWPARYGWPTE
jgi:hypothetical protein